MECSNCGACYHIISINGDSDENGIVCCEICGELILSKESSNFWSAQLIESSKTSKMNTQI